MNAEPLTVNWIIMVFDMMTLPIVFFDVIDMEWLLEAAEMKEVICSAVLWVDEEVKRRLVHDLPDGFEGSVGTHHGQLVEDEVVIGGCI